MRYNMTLHVSSDEGRSWRYVKTIDKGTNNPTLLTVKGPSAYSSLVVLPDMSIGLLYEWSKELTSVFVPDHISFKVILSGDTF